MADIIRWRPLPGTVKPRAINTRLDHVDGEGRRIYRVWPAGLPEPPGNPVKISEETLRQTYEMVNDEDAGE
jgi:hypothetical protein